MIPALVRFADALRTEGVVVSPAELLDAGRALALVGVEQRSEVRLALKATLTKDRRSSAVFDRLFDRFFAAPRRPSNDSKDREPGGGEGAPGRSRPSSDDGTPLTDKPSKTRPKANPSGSRRPNDNELSRILAHEQRGDRRTGRLRRAHLQVGQKDRGGDRDDGAHNPARKLLAARMTADAERRLAEEVPRLVQALKLRAGRRMTRSASGRPWLRGALRRSTATGGVPFTIPLRAPKRKRSRVVVLADVSFSVARASGLFLLMAKSFLELGRRNRVLLFVDRPVDATDAIRRWTAPDSFMRVVDGLKDLNPMAPSDYGTALHALLNSSFRPRGRDTILVILGDGRTNQFDPLPWALEELSRGCRAVLWLAPEPRQRWGTGDSALPAYLPFVDVIVETADLEGLAIGLAALIRRL